jgi:hypothetical protein
VLSLKFMSMFARLLPVNLNFQHSIPDIDSTHQSFLLTLIASDQEDVDIIELRVHHDGLLRRRGALLGAGGREPGGRGIRQAVEEGSEELGEEFEVVRGQLHLDAVHQPFNLFLLPQQTQLET